MEQIPPHHTRLVYCTLYCTGACGLYSVQSTSTSRRTLLLTHCITRGQYWGSGSASWSVGSICFWASQICIRFRSPQVRIRIRILPSSSKISKKNLDFFCFVTSLWFFTSPRIRIRLRIRRILIFSGFLDPRPDTFVRGTDSRIRIRIRIRIKMSRIPNTARRYVKCL